MNSIREKIEELRAAFARLTPREQTLVAATSAAVFLFILLGVGWMVSSAIDKAERRLQVKMEVLQEILAKEGEYRARKMAQEARVRSLRSRSNVRLVKIVEDAAKSSGVQIGQLSPEEGEPNESGIVLSRVDLRAQDLSIDRLQDFLARLEESPGLVTVERMKIDKPYRKETLNVDLTITTYRKQS